ncbi:MAG: adenylosuccinate synthetase [Sandaracinaceae bacterium]|nr:adenylosuccinate synthetase [Sandaracinaceae bacterium]
MAVAYEKDGARLAVPPSIGLERVTPIYEGAAGLDGGSGRHQGPRRAPANARAYVRRIEELAGVPVSLLSLGAERTQTITVADPWR